MEQTERTAECAVCVLHPQNKLVEGEGYPQYREQHLQLLKEWDPY